MLTNVCMVAMFSSSLQPDEPSQTEEVENAHPSPRYSPIIDLLSPSVCNKNRATSCGALLGMNPVSSKNCMP